MIGQANLHKTDGTWTALREWTMHQLISSNNLSVTWTVNNVTVMQWGKNNNNNKRQDFSSQDNTTLNIDVLNLKLETAVWNESKKLQNIKFNFNYFLISATEKKIDQFPWSFVCLKLEFWSVLLSILADHCSFTNLHDVTLIYLKGQMTKWTSLFVFLWGNGNC